MSTIQGAVGGSGGAQDFGPRDWAGASWRGRGCGASRWSLFEIVAMVLGFIVFWPIGLAILGFKLWQRKAGYSGDLQTVAQEKWREARSAMSSGPWQGRRGGFQGFHSSSTGNSAFDDWKSAEIARLEEERRKLQEAHREFAAFVDNIRRSKDREEFERFMNERRNRPADGAPGQGPSA
ncbi:DUF2852 domain-containing protein [Methylocapsa sp. S129]|uniref:DUF2852 domain-containing protein n=1 Tax=Methylocapsa sp. S129 TaxID=1641869 RepID=UPI00131CD2D7|nr:DUF2852 domain-containing protein [Methylocapsa sp. S129]